MTTDALPLRRVSFFRAVLYGGLAVGVLDALDALFFFGLIKGAPPIRIFQAIAGGILGRSTFDGGVATLLMGLGLHFFIAFSIALTYALASRRLPILIERPWLCGAVYGVLVFFFMSYVVVPLSAAGAGRFSVPWLLNGLVGHALLVGMPSALFARRGAGDRPFRP